MNSFMNFLMELTDIIKLTMKGYILRKKYIWINFEIHICAFGNLRKCLVIEEGN